jgi:hypothetical protein
MPVVIILFLTIVFGILFSIILKSASLLPMEKGITPVFKTRCSGIIGSTHFKGPFISLRVYNDFVVISTLKKLVFTFNEIKTAEITKKWNRNITKISHNKAGYPDKIILFFINNNFINLINSNAKIKEELTTD